MNMIIKGGDKFCCPKCKSKLSVSIEVNDYGEEGAFDYVEADEIMQCVWFNGIQIDSMPEPEDAVYTEGVKDGN